MLIIIFLNFFNQVNSTEGVLPYDELRKKFNLQFLKDP